MTVKEAIEILQKLPPEAQVQSLVVNLLQRSSVGVLGGILGPAPNPYSLGLGKVN